jgi:hypothetical protein
MNSVVDFPIALSETSSAPLPQVYEAARAALAALDSIDECKSWADTAADLLNERSIASPGGGRWHATSVLKAARRLGFR